MTFFSCIIKQILVVLQILATMMLSILLPETYLFLFDFVIEISAASGFCIDVQGKVGHMLHKFSFINNKLKRCFSFIYSNMTAFILSYFAIYNKRIIVRLLVKTMQA